MEKICLKEKLSLFHDKWTPKIIGSVNGHLIKIAKASGELVWHKHDSEDELFLVLSGKLTIQLRDRSVELGPGELFIVPQGVEHCPKAEDGTEFLMVEPPSTLHTGQHVTQQTVPLNEQDWI